MSKTTEQEFLSWLAKPENYNLEFKEAKNQFDHQNELPKYCSALANERGGFLILGIVDRTKTLVGTKAFLGNHTTIANDLANKLGGLRVDVDELYIEGKRILIFRVPTRPTGRVVKFGKIAWVRFGESCKDMPEDQYRKILEEVRTDESQEIVAGADLSHIDNEALKQLQQLWSQETGKPEYIGFDTLKILTSLGLAEDENHISLACLLLVGTEQALKKFIPQSEIILEWRHDKNMTNFDFRTEIRKPFVLAIEEIWGTINARNIRFPFQEGFIQRQVWAYHEKSVREAVINAFVHRDYQMQGGSIYILFSPDGMVVESPGGLAGGITIENILYKKYARNRLLADACVMIDLMEKSGQGIDDIFRESISSGKGKPIIWEDGYEVKITLPAVLQDPEFVKFIERVENERQSVLPFEAVLELENIRTVGSLSTPEHKDKLLQLGLIENIGHGRGTKYILSQKYYQESGNTGTYTKLVGLDRDIKKEYILKYLDQHKQGKVSDFHTLFPEMKIKDLSNLVSELRRDGVIIYHGKKPIGYWKKTMI